MRIFVLFFFSLFVFNLGCPSAKAAAEVLTGNTYLASCDNALGSPKEYCTSFLSGYLQGFYTGKAIFLDNSQDEKPGQANPSMKDPPPCVPQGADVKQVYDILINYLHDHPANRQNNLALITWFALSQAWPCAKPLPTSNIDDKVALRTFLNGMNLHPKPFCIGSVCMYWKTVSQTPTPP